MLELLLLSVTRSSASCCPFLFELAFLIEATITAFMTMSKAITNKQACGRIVGSCMVELLVLTTFASNSFAFGLIFPIELTIEMNLSTFITTYEQNKS